MASSVSRKRLISSRRRAAVSNSRSAAASRIFFSMASMTAALAADIERIDEIWNDCRHRFGTGGPWLFGAEYTIADAMYAPVVLRFNTYGARVSDTARWYMATVLEDAALQEWLRAAQVESWTIPADEVG